MDQFLPTEGAIHRQECLNCRLSKPMNSPIPDARLQQARRLAAQFGRPRTRKRPKDQGLGFALAPVSEWLLKWMKRNSTIREAKQRKLTKQLERDLEQATSGSPEADLTRLALNFIKEGSGPVCVLPENATAAKLAAIVACVERPLSHLERLAAAGNAQAAEALANHALRVCKVLSKIRKHHSKLLKPVPRRSVVWPVLKSHVRCFDDTAKPAVGDEALLLDELEVGKAHPISGQRWNASDPLSG